MDDAAYPTGGAAVPSGDGDDLAFYARLVADHCHDAIVVTDTEGRTAWVNAAFERISGYRLDEVRGRKPGEILQGAETDVAAAADLGAALAERRPVRAELLNYTKTGAPYWIELHVSPVFDGAGRHTHFIAVERDITERRELEERSRAVFAAEEYKQAERRLLVEMSEWLYSAKSQDELLSVVELSMRTIMPEADGALYVYAAERDTLARRASWGDTRATDHVMPDECWSLRRGRAYHFGGQSIQLPCEHVGRADHPFFCLPIIAQGETIGLMHLVFPAFALDRPGDARAHDEFLRQRWMTALTCAEQISLAIANVRLRDELEERSVRDQLTGLWNRRWFLESGAQLMRRTLATRAPLALLVADVDHFKEFNDRYGHDAGDRVLREVAAAMAAECAAPAAPVRIGGEEFAILLPGVGADQAAEAAERLRERIAALALRHMGRALPRVTISVGHADAPQDGATLTDLLGAADRALYAAKDTGRNRVVASADVPRLVGPPPPRAARDAARDEVDRAPRRAARSTRAAGPG